MGPLELARIGVEPADFKRAANKEYHGPCPRCNGIDRFVVWTDRDFPHWRWMCRQCAPDGGWLDELEPQLKEPLTTEQAAEIARKREESLKREIQRAQKALEDLQEAQRWERYHQQLTSEARMRWESWGIPHSWQEFWQLGYEPSFAYTYNGERYTSPTMTIPIFEPETWECLNIRHRLLEPADPGDKYRPDRVGLPYPLFVADPTRQIKNKTILVEGEKKAAVTYITANSSDIQVVGAPGKQLKADALLKFRDADPLYICWDPDGRQEAIELAHKFGRERTRIIEVPGKIDDLIIAHGLGQRWLQEAMRQAVKV